MSIIKIPESKYGKIITASILLALAMVIPLFTGQIPQIGKMLCPMHLPVMLCGIVCGPVYGLIVGFLAPILRFVIFGMPALMPTGLIMCLELATYGAITGILTNILPKKKISIYITLIAAIIAGRIVWGAMHVIFLQLGGFEFSWSMFITAGFVNSFPGIIAQLIIIPLLV